MMITPTRFGLKFGPIPTLALEYEDDLTSLADGLSTTSLYVYSGKEQEQRRTKKLHVMELPALTRNSEPMAVARQLQQDNRRFLAPDVVKEDQLVRLLERLMAHLQVTELSVSPSQPAAVTKDTGDAATRDGDGSQAGTFGLHSVNDQDEEDDRKESELEESALDESVAKVSVSMDALKADDSDEDGDESPKVKPETGASTSESAEVETAGAGESAKQPDVSQALTQSQEATDGNEDNDTSPAKPSNDDREAEDEAREEQEDDAKRRALMSESESSDDNEDEDIQSEELEYFSEDASDEDSF